MNANLISSINLQSLPSSPSFSSYVILFFFNGH